MTCRYENHPEYEVQDFSRTLQRGASTDDILRIIQTSRRVDVCLGCQALLVDILTLAANGKARTSTKQLAKTDEPASRRQPATHHNTRSASIGRPPGPRTKGPIFGHNRAKPDDTPRGTRLNQLSRSNEHPPHLRHQQDPSRTAIKAHHFCGPQDLHTRHRQSDHHPMRKRQTRRISNR